MKFWKRRTIAPYEEVEYEPVTVLDLLTEMKDLSELMTSLAYSALVLHSENLRDEVEELGARMDLLKYQMRLSASLSVRNKEEAEQVAGILQIADASEQIAGAAEEMVEILDDNVKLRPFLARVLNDADDRIGTVKVPTGSRAEAKTLGDLDLQRETGVRVLAVRRGNRWIYHPDAHTELRADDTLLIQGQFEGADHFQSWLEGKEDEL